MSRAVLLTGGWMHPAHLSQPLVHLLSERFDRVDVVDDPTQVVAAVDDPPDLMVVNACWFAMTDARYTAEQRAQNAVDLDDRSLLAIDHALSSRSPLLAIHTAVLCFDGWPVWTDALGATWDWATSFHPPPETVTVEPVGGNDFLTQSFTILDEEYQQLRVGSTAAIVARSDNGHPLVWTTQHGPGRVAVDLLGHGPESLGHPAHQQMLHNLIQWLTNGE